MFKKLKQQAAAQRLFEEKLYQRVVDELAQQIRRDGLWAKALAEGNGNDAIAKGLYIKYRVQALKDEAELLRAWEETDRAQNEMNEKQQALHRIDHFRSLLDIQGYKLKLRGSGFVVREPLGGTARLNSIEELEEYCKGRGV